MKKTLLLILTSLLLTACSPTQDKAEQSKEGKQEENNEQQDNSSNNNEENDSQNQTKEEENKETEDNDNEEKTLTKSHANQILNKYKATFIELAENTGKHGKLTNYESKEELTTYFKTIMSTELAQWYTETYFRQENGELFLKAMDAPTWLVNDKPFSLEKINEQKYNVIQERNNGLLGHVNMIYKLSLQDGQWVVSSIDREELNNSNDNSTSLVTEEEAIATVRQKLEISKDSDTIVEFDHFDDNGNYIIHVYDKVDHENGSHNATVGWYIVDNENGKVENMF